MTATLQSTHVKKLADKLGRASISESMVLPPFRAELKMSLKVVADPRQLILKLLAYQAVGGKAIVFCMYKKTVAAFATLLREKQSRPVFECVSGELTDVGLFAAAESAIMVCTSVLNAGVSFLSVTRVFFLEAAHHPENFLQGSGRGAREEGVDCISVLVTSERALNFIKQSDMAQAAAMADICQLCITSGTELSDELFRMFDPAATAQVIASMALLVSDNKRPRSEELSVSRPKQFPRKDAGGSVSIPKEDPPCKDTSDPVHVLRMILGCRKVLKCPDMSDKCYGLMPTLVSHRRLHYLAGCGGSCKHNKCDFLTMLHDASKRHRHCQGCLLPLVKIAGFNLHPSLPGWNGCETRNKEQIRNLFALASRGMDIGVSLPAGFPVTGFQDSVAWAFTIVHGLPNIVRFVQCLYEL